MANSALCGLSDDRYSRGTYTAEGITKLCEGLKGSSVTSLECAAAPSAFAFVSAPADTYLPSYCAPTPIPRRLWSNSIGLGEGASALAAVLKETKITTLGCAAAQYYSISRHTLTSLLSRHIQSAPRSQC